MKKFLATFVLLLVSSFVSAQTQQLSGGPANQNVPPAYVTPDCTLTGSLSAVGTSTVLNNSDTGCSTWNIVYDTNFASLSIEVDFASQSATLGVPTSFTIWPAAQVGNGTLPLTTATEGAATLSGYHPFVQINLTAKTGTGSVKYKLFGWKGQGSSDVVNSANSVVGATTAADPCQSSGVVKQSIFKNITTATTTAVVAASGSTVIYVCGYYAVMSASAASSDTILLEDGTGAACVTTQIPKTPTYNSGLLSAGATPVGPVGFAGQSTFQTAVGGEVCAVSTVGTTPAIGLFITYVQK
jgi:hypothetical protein